MRIARLVLAALVSASVPALAQSGAYPASRCAKPDAALIKPPDYSNKGNWAAADAYNNKVKLYNSQAQAYAVCTRAYIDAAVAERGRIQSEANERIRHITNEANGRLQQINDAIAAAQQDANLVAAQEQARQEDALPRQHERIDPRAAIHRRHR